LIKNADFPIEYYNKYKMESRRLQKEYEELTKLSTSSSGVQARNIGSDMTH
jgi:hypothetical protein